MKRLKVASSKIDKQSLIEKVLDNGYIEIDNGQSRFVVTQINDQNFFNISEKFKTQLEAEGKYDSWIGFIASNPAPYDTQVLPIFGSATSYVTKWFTNTAEESIEMSLKDKQLNLLNRI